MMDTQEMLKAAGEKIVASLNALGGISGLVKRKISARWQVTDPATFMTSPGIDIVAEIKAALLAEINAEVVLGLAVQARSTVVPEIVDMQGKLGFGDDAVVPKALLRTATGMKNPLFILSPMQFTLLQASSREGFAPVSEPKEPMAITQMATFYDRPVFVDPYAGDTVPALVCDEGWFHYIFDDLITSSQHGDIITFETDVTIIPIWTRFKTLAITNASFI